MWIQLLVVIIIVVIVNNRDWVSVAGGLDFPVLFRTSRLLASRVSILILIIVLGLLSIVFLVVFLKLVFLFFVIFSILGCGALGLLFGC